MRERTHRLEKFDQFLTEKAEGKVNRICRGAARVFSIKGFCDTTLADVSRAAGVSKGGIYHYFATKEELLFTILNRHMDKVLGGLKEKLKDITVPQEKIRFFIERHIELYCNNVHESRLILHETNTLPPKRWKVVREKTKEYTAILRDMIEDFLERENGISEKVKVYAYSLLGMCNWIYWWYDPKGPVKPEELAEEIYTIFVGNLKAK